MSVLHLHRGNVVELEAARRARERRQEAQAMRELYPKARVNVSPAMPVSWWPGCLPVLGPDDDRSGAA